MQLWGPVDSAPHRLIYATAADSQFDISIYLFCGPIQILIDLGGKNIISSVHFETNNLIIVIHCI